MKTMSILCSCVVICACLSALRTAADAADKPAETSKLLSHNVYFALNDTSAEAKKKFIDSCKQHLSQHPGTVFFTVGTHCDEEKGMFNDHDYDVALTIVFTSHEALHKYHTSKAHDEFLAESKPNFKSVRVFDVDVEPMVMPADTPTAR